MATEELNNNHPMKNLNSVVKEDYVKGLVFIAVEDENFSEDEKSYITSLMKNFEIHETKLAEFEEFAQEPDEDELVAFIERIKKFNENIKIIFLIESVILRLKNGELTEEEIFNDYLEILDLEDKKDAIICMAKASISKDKDLTFSLDTIENELKITIDKMQKEQKKEDADTLSDSNDTIIIDWKNAKCITTLYESEYPVRSVVFTPDGKLITSDDEDVRVWDLKDNKCIQTLRGIDGTVSAVTCSRDGQYIAAAGRNDKTIKVWKDGKCIQTLEDADKLISNIAFSPDGKSIVSAGRGPIRIWENGECVEELIYKKDKGTHAAFALSPDGQYIATLIIGSKQWFQVWKDEKCIESQRLSRRGGLSSSITFSPDGKSIVSGRSDTIDIWENGNCIKTLEYGANSIVFSSDGKYMITAGNDKSIKIWEDEECIATLNGHSDTIYSVAISPDGKYIASGSSDRTVKIWGTEQ